MLLLGVGVRRDFRFEKIFGAARETDQVIDNVFRCHARHFHGAADGSQRLAGDKDVPVLLPGFGIEPEKARIEASAAQKEEDGENA